MFQRMPLTDSEVILGKTSSPTHMTLFYRVNYDVCYVEMKSIIIAHCSLYLSRFLCLNVFANTKLIFNA